MKNGTLVGMTCRNDNLVAFVKTAPGCCVILSCDRLGSAATLRTGYYTDLGYSDEMHLVVVHDVQLQYRDSTEVYTDDVVIEVVEYDDMWSYWRGIEQVLKLEDFWATELYRLREWVDAWWTLACHLNI